jgi:colanic acid/amylovoran biosynthesis glycosyltransferase
MKIAFVLGEFPTLSETFILNQIIGLIQHGYQVDIYAKYCRNEPKIHPDIHRYGLLERTYYDPFTPEKKTYDIIHCHFGLSGLDGLKLLELGILEGMLITSFHGFDVTLYPLKFGIDIYQQLFQRGDLFTGGTSFIINKALALGCPKEKIIKLPVGIDTVKYSFHERKVRFNEPIKLLTVARLVEKKGIEYSLRSVAKTISSYPNLEYNIIGDGYLREALETLIKELGICEKVKILGWMTQDEIIEFYSNADIFILASVTAANGDQEGQGLVLQEAQAIGIPVLSTIHNGIPDGVLDGESGFLVAEKDVDALTQKLNYLIENPIKRVEMGKVGRKFIEDYYDNEKLIERLITIYKQMLKV